MTIKNKVREKIYLYPNIVVNMTDKDTISKVASIFGTKVFQLENGRRIDGTPGLPLFRATTSGKRAVILMEAVLPYMSIRRSKKINEILELHKAKPEENEARKAASLKLWKTRRENE